MPLDPPVTSRSPAHSQQPLRDVLTSPAIVVLTFNRAEYLRKTLRTLLQLREAPRYTVYVSQDGFDQEVVRAVKEFPVTHIQHVQQPARENHEHIARHYKFILDEMFVERKHSHVILVEDDMLVSPDFLRYFEVAAPLLDMDPTLWCVSSWNDNAFPRFELSHSRLFRTSYFPGLGWMLKRSLWLELRDAFPSGHWDHWMRLSVISKNRDCIVPEVSRNYNIGVSGANMDTEKYNRFFKDVVYSTRADVDFGDVSYLLLENYARRMRGIVSKAVTVYEEPMKMAPSSEPVLCLYTKENFAQWADVLGVWPHPRTHHRHTLVLTLHGATAPIILADRRHSPYVPEHRAERVRTDMTIVKSSVGGSCVEACSQRGERCDVSQFDFVNNCEELQRAFPCERGYANVQGPDIPNYVTDPSDQYYQQCLVTDHLPTCDARHSGNIRLCPCVK